MNYMQTAHYMKFARNPKRHPQETQSGTLKKPKRNPKWTLKKHYIKLNPKNLKKKNKTKRNLQKHPMKPQRNPKWNLK